MGKASRLSRRLDSKVGDDNERKQELRGDK